MNERIRIRFLHTRFPHWCGRSGFTQIVRHLDPVRFRTVLDGASDSDEDVPRWLAPATPYLTRLARAGNMPWYKLSDLMAEFRALPPALAGRHDVVHFLDAEHSGQYLPRIMRRLRRSRPCTIATFHQPPGLQRQLINPDLVRCFDHVTIFSPSQLPVFEECLPRERIHLIPHGIDTDFFHPPAAPRRDGNHIRCITVGHWLRDWRVMRGVAEAFRTDDRVVFDVVTSRETGLEELPNVVHHRSIPDAELAELYRQADILLLPLEESTANNALLEGIASGLPVVSTAVPGTRFHLSGKESVLFPVGDIPAYVAAVGELQHDPGRRLQMGRRARQRAEELAWTNVTRRFAAIYRGSVEGQPNLEIARRAEEGLGNEEYP